jgi:hypothetical protein
MCFEEVPYPPYIVRGAGLQIWKLIVVDYNCHSWPDKDSYSNRLGSCLISKFSFLVWDAEHIDWAMHRLLVGRAL